MRFSDRTYTLGDRVFFLSQRPLSAEDEWEPIEDLPLYGNASYDYVLVEALVSAINLPFAPFGRELTEQHHYTTGINVSFQRRRDARMMLFMYNTDPISIGDVNTVLNTNCADNVEKRDFLRQFLLPLTVSTAQYNKLLTDVARAAGRDPAAVTSTDKETLVARATELGVKVVLMDPNASSVTTRMSPTHLQTYRTWDEQGLPGVNGRPYSPTEDDEMGLESDDEDEEDS